MVTRGGQWRFCRTEGSDGQMTRGAVDDVSL